MFDWKILLISATAIVIANSGLKIFLKRFALLFFKKELKRVKPFDCALCLALWLGLWQYWSGMNFQSFGCAFVCALCAETLFRLFKLIPMSV